MKRTWKLSDEDKDKIAELYGDPANKVDWIAAKYGISKRNVLQLAWARGYPKRSAVHV